jgi:hypothetical protein
LFVSSGWGSASIAIDALPDGQRIHVGYALLDEDGYPMGIVAYDAENVIPLRARSVGAMGMKPGKRCGECGNYAVILKDGCDFCTACGAVRGGG